MINAKVVNNIPVCGKCDNNNLSGARSCKQVVMNNESYTMIIKHCYNCGEDNAYLLDATIDKETRYEINDVIKDIES